MLHAKHFAVCAVPQRDVKLCDWTGFVPDAGRNEFTSACDLVPQSFGRVKFWSALSPPFTPVDKLLGLS
ncbi:MAG TPA: hypothetical protein VFB72_05555, partial [Verrucomicrobiae bacterium]|nr:hypothetical protein [Verrucomicrobiae bacterium]